MKKRTLLVFSIFLFFTLNARCETKTARGYQDVGVPGMETQKGATPINVGPNGAFVIKAHSDCAKGGWIEKVVEGNRIEHFKFSDIDQIQGYTFKGAGIYYIYPTPAEECPMTSIIITYKDLAAPEEEQPK